MWFLLERLADPSLPGQGSQDGETDLANLKAAVEAQLQRIVGARAAGRFEAGSGPLAGNLLDFGLPHVVELALNNREQLERYAVRLARLIERYEPRLLRPRVTIERSGRALMPYQLRVSGSLHAEAEPESFCFELPAH